MKTLTSSVLAAVALALGGAAFAATPAKPTMATCDALMKQFDQVVGTHGMAAKVSQAKEMRAKGEQSCKAGNYQRGVADLHTALNDIGVKPIEY